MSNYDLVSRLVSFVWFARGFGMVLRLVIGRRGILLDLKVEYDCMLKNNFYETSFWIVVRLRFELFRN